MLIYPNKKEVAGAKFANIAATFSRLLNIKIHGKCAKLKEKTRGDSISNNSTRQLLIATTCSLR